jgi:hypothetical protein
MICIASRAMMSQDRFATKDEAAKFLLDILQSPHVLSGTLTIFSEETNQGSRFFPGELKDNTLEGARALLLDALKGRTHFIGAVDEEV